MNPSTTTDLMHAVLDGEANPDEVRELDLRLASDAAARAEFEALRQMFDDLGRVPPRLPPEDLQARLLAKANQPLASPRVIGSSTLRDIFSKFISTLRHTFTADTYRNGADMKKMWIGGAVAVVAVVGVAQFVLGDKPASKDTMGTIVPADRYRAPQPTAADVKVGSPTGAGTGTDERPPARDGAQADAGGAKANSGTAAAAADAGGAKANSGTAAAAADAGGAKANSGTAAAAADASGAKANSGTAAAAADASGAKAKSGTAAAAADASGAKANSGTAAAAADASAAKAKSGTAAAAADASGAKANSGTAAAAADASGAKAKSGTAAAAADASAAKANASVNKQ